MSSEQWIDRLYNDESLWKNLSEGEAEKVRTWAESRLDECEADSEAQHLFDWIRLLNRYRGEGKGFEDLFVALRATFNAGMHADNVFTERPDDSDPTFSEVYPSD